MKQKVIITGATGMVGEGVLHECLQNPEIVEVLVINRKPSGKKHSKLKEYIHLDFLNFTNIPIDFSQYDACCFCLGVSSLGISKEDYFKLTYTLTLHVAQTMVDQNPRMIFSYVSGAGTDSSEKGILDWAQVKGKTENDLLKLPFQKTYMFRPGFLEPTPGLKNAKSYYKYFNWLSPVLRLFFSNHISTLRELGLAMLHVTQHGYPKSVLEVVDIKQAAKAYLAQRGHVPITNF